MTYGVDTNKCLKPVVKCRFQETLELEPEEIKTEVFRDNAITEDSVAVINFSGTFYQEVQLHTSIVAGAVFVRIVNTSTNSMPISFNVVVI